MISGFPVYKTLLCEVILDTPGARDAIDRDDDDEAVEVDAGPQRLVYLDNNATTAILPQVQEAMLPYIQGTYGNPSSVHGPGRDARAAVDGARRRVAEVLGCTARRVVFTRGHVGLF